VLSGWLPVVVQAVRTADAAASEKARRLRREVDCVNDFSNNGASSYGGYRGLPCGRDQANRIAGGDRIAPR
jgi:hypothetical protein